ncbi:MAG: hypothetical protein MR716_00435 [Tenericutes bacterium]|nr:hypothetical protein [Mycoplasmatota bacterium]
MKSFLKGLWGFVEVVIIIYVICITACLLSTNKFGFTQFDDTTLLTISSHMEQFLPESKEHDLIIVKNTPREIVVGDKIYYYATADNKYIVKTAHVKEIVSQDGTTALYKLDDEASSTIATTRVIGKYSAIYHNIGGILDILESKIGFLLLVILPILLIFMYQIYALIIVIKYGEEEIENEPRKKETPKKKESTKKEKEEIELL